VSGFGTSDGRPIYGRGPSPGLRFTIYALLSLGLLYLDQRAGWSARIRYGLEAGAYPIQVAINSPATVWHGLVDALATRNQLRAENSRLEAQLRELQVGQLRTQALEEENANLRGLHAALPPLVAKWQVAEVIGRESALLRQRLIINKGAHDGVHLNQAVVDGTGVLGQVMHVGPYSAEVILITDPEHALPVQVVRNQLRTIAVGSGSASELLLKFLAVNSDVQGGDLLVSSGLGGVFPAGFPVARITGVRREANQLLAQVRAEPLARIDSSREVMLLDFDPQHPAAPADDKALAEGRAPDAATTVPAGGDTDAARKKAKADARNEARAAGKGGKPAAKDPPSPADRPTVTTPLPEAQDMP
jgi:rod shape-determining protein MreC